MIHHWHWYVAREDELLMDCDSHTLLQLMMKRLDDVNRIGFTKLPEVKEKFVTYSNRSGHYHVALLLAEPVPLIERMVWQLYLFDDIYRSTQNLFRAIHNIPAPCLLISPVNWCLSLNAKTRFWRNADAVCFCDERMHKSKKLMADCPAHKRLRGAIAAINALLENKQ